MSVSDSTGHQSCRSGGGVGQTAVICWRGQRLTGCKCWLGGAEILEKKTSQHWLYNQQLSVRALGQKMTPGPVCVLLGHFPPLWADSESSFGLGFLWVSANAMMFADQCHFIHTSRSCITSFKNTTTHSAQTDSPLVLLVLFGPLTYIVITLIVCNAMTADDHALFTAAGVPCWEFSFAVVIITWMWLSYVLFD